MYMDTDLGFEDLEDYSEMLDLPQEQVQTIVNRTIRLYINLIFNMEV